MKYYLYNTHEKIIATADDVKTALQSFGEIYDEDPYETTDYIVGIFIEIKQGKLKPYERYYLPNFLNISPEFLESIPEQEDLDQDSKLMTPEQFEAYNAGNDKRIDEMAQGFTDEEMTAIIKYVPTGFIVGELARRLQEYDNATNEIQHILSSMKIYQSDKKGI